MNSFFKSVIIPFISGILGTVLVIGIGLGIPSVREKFITTTAEVSSSKVEKQNEVLTSLSNYSDTSISVANRVLPSVVGIQVEFTNTGVFGRQTSQAEGSGIIIKEDGYILTNNHVVSGESSNYMQLSEANKITVYLYNDSTPYEGTIVGKDDITDLAVIKIEKTDLIAATLGNSANVKVGEFAMAIGNPMGLKSSVTCGIISAVNREMDASSTQSFKLIQTDAAINSGNSGGALVNASGEVIGVNTLKFAGSGVEGMGFAIPISSTTDIVSELIQYNKVRRPYIGISGVAVDEKISQRYGYPIGVYVNGVETFSPAEKADIQKGDVILKLDGQDVKTVDEINNIKNSKKIGDEIEVIFNRDDKEKTVKLKLEEQP